MPDLYSQLQLLSAQECIASCSEMRRAGRLEDVLRHNLSSYLRLMFTDNPAWVTLHIRGSEAQVEFSRNQRQHRGFVDSLVGATAIEYEGNLQNSGKFRNGYQQVKEYCSGLLNLGYPAHNIRGILSDTVQWFAYDVRILDRNFQGIYSADDIELIQVDNLNCESDTNANYLLLDFLNKHLGRIGSRLITAESISSDLGFASMLAVEYIPRLTGALQEISVGNPAYSELIRSIWNRFVNSVRDNQTTDSFDIEFYVNEYYLTTIAKFLCANVINGSALVSNSDEAESILNGEFFKLRGYANVVEYDFFGWLNNLPIHTTIINLAEKIQLDLRAYDYTLTIHEDLFSNLFSELASKSKRLLLGQAMTPSWLANSIIKKVIDNIEDSPRLIDMCCGSGTFVVETIKIVSSDFNENTTLDEKRFRILSCITGFDIDPLAVILARINWLIVAKPHLSISGADSINIPIFNADSLFAVTPVSTDEVREDSFSLQLLDQQVNLPKQLLSPSNKSLFEKILDVGYSVVIQLPDLPSSEFYEETFNRICSQLNQVYTEDDRTVYIQFMQEYFSAIFELHAQGRNGIWNFLILNSYRPALVENSFNGLVSNPPWLTLSRIANNPYSLFLQNLAEELNIRPQGSSFLHIELATIFLLSSIKRYLIEGAAIGCIMPGTLLSGDHHHQFRNMSYRESNVYFKIFEIWDLEKSIFNNRGITVFGTNVNDRNSYPIPSKVIHSNADDQDIELYLSTLDTKSAWTNFNINRTDVDSYVTNFKQGADIMPRSLYFHDIAHYDPARNFSDVNPINLQTSDKSYLLKESKKFSNFRIEACQIETSALFPVMISNSLLPFHITNPPIAILPIEKHTGVWRSLSPSSLVTMSTGFKRWIRRASNNYDNGNVGTLWSFLNERSKLSNQILPQEGFIVCSGTGGELVCAHYLRHEDIDFSRLILDQTVNYFHTINEDEAIYLVGLLNSAAISHAIRAFQAVGNFGARHIHSLPYRIIEPFDKENTLHIDVVTNTRLLIHDLNTLLTVTTDRNILRLINPNESSIAFKRRKIRKLITILPSFENYTLACDYALNV
ncbi:N-6 DNA methylase [uncultured Chryseobacterium sp.]|uniref:N-6 DNA methylase n=1 Tax=uncultured Chryseobacterium sp. TaxID=259322 RepID=UPI0025FA562A|nr:N-6 DNA methylase [uncultured Chryseobacterium sp.]